MEMTILSSVSSFEISFITVAAAYGFTAMNITSEFLVSSQLSLHALQPNEENKSNLGCHGSVQYIFSHGTIPELEKPPPRASAIIPDPINPTFVFELLLIVFSKYFKFNVVVVVVVVVVVCWCKKFSL
jgi:hypothetical protein